MCRIAAGNAVGVTALQSRRASTYFSLESSSYAAHSQNVTMTRISRQEWLWVGLASLMFVLLAKLPYFVGYLVETDELQFAGVTLAPVDSLSYLAKMQQGFAGRWTFQLPYTAESHEGAPVYLYYLFLGHVVRWIGLSVPLVYHLAGIISGLALLLTAYYFICQMIDTLTERRYLFALLGFSSGFGWLMIGFGELLSTDLTVPESNTFFTLMHCPHFSLSQTLILVIVLSFASGKGSWKRRTVIGTAACILLVLVQPFMLFVVFGTLGLYGLAVWKRDQRMPLRLIVQGSTSLLVILPVLIMSYRAIYDNPAMREWTEQSVSTSPLVFFYLTGYGLILPMAIFGMIWAVRRRTDADLMLVCWILVAVVGLYLPFSFQRRLSQGLHFPLAVLAGIGALRFGMSRFSVSKARLWARLYLLATYPTNLVLIVLFSGGAVLHHSQLFISADERMALDWITSQPERNIVVLSSTELGSLLPAFAPLRVVSGHDFETLNAEAVKAAVRQFYASDSLPQVRAELVRQWLVDYVLVGPRERELGIVTLSAEDGVVPVGTFGEVEVFQRIR